jgi:hypothetical protein
MIGRPRLCPGGTVGGHPAAQERHTLHQIAISDLDPAEIRAQRRGADRGAPRVKNSFNSYTFSALMTLVRRCVGAVTLIGRSTVLFRSRIR